MLKPITEKQKTLIINNLVKACKDISSLNKTGYNYIYLTSGFIAHCDLYGFINYYKRSSLKFDILNCQAQNQWANFRKGEKDYEYYAQKRDVYNAICDKIKN